MMSVALTSVGVRAAQFFLTGGRCVEIVGYISTFNYILIQE
jgi:hypothetical protein